MYNNIVSTECQEEILIKSGCNVTLPECQEEILNDVSASGNKRDWAEKKYLADLMANVYDYVDIGKARRIRDCASWLKYVKVGDGMKLHDARFCRVRMCPICQWRRAQKTFAQMLKVWETAVNDGYEFLFFTITWKNIPAEELSQSIDDAMAAWNRFRGYKAIQQATAGWYRGFEVTYNEEEDTYHPHIHVIFAVRESYFHSRYYLNKQDWKDLWRRAMRLDYDPRCRIEQLKGGIKGLAETCKYTCKTKNVLMQEDFDLSIRVVDVLNGALANRRFIGTGGIIKEIHKRLNLDDMEDGDLTHVEAEPEEIDCFDDVIYFFWNGFNYYRG